METLNRRKQSNISGSLALPEKFAPKTAVHWKDIVQLTSYSISNMAVKILTFRQQFIFQKEGCHALSRSVTISSSEVFSLHI